MNVGIFKRNIKLQELGIGNLSIKEQEILDFLNKNLTNLNAYACDKYFGYLFFGKDNEDIILKYSVLNGFLYLHSDKIWSFLEYRFNMGYSEIQELLMWWVDGVLNLRVENCEVSKQKYPLLPATLFKVNNTH